MEWNQGMGMAINPKGVGVEWKRERRRGRNKKRERERERERLHFACEPLRGCDGGGLSRSGLGEPLSLTSSGLFLCSYSFTTTTTTTSSQTLLLQSALSSSSFYLYSVSISSPTKLVRP